MSNAKTTSEVRVIPSNQPTASPTLIHPREPGLEYYIDHRGVRYPPPPPLLLFFFPQLPSRFPLPSLYLFDSCSSICDSHICCCCCCLYVFGWVIYHVRFFNLNHQDDFLIITNVGNQMKDYAIMRVAEKDVGSGREHWQTVLSPSPGTQIEDVDVFSSHIIWYGPHITISFRLTLLAASHPSCFFALFLFDAAPPRANRSLDIFFRRLFYYDLPNQQRIPLQLRAVNGSSASAGVFSGEPGGTPGAFTRNAVHPAPGRQRGTYLLFSC